MDRLKVGVVGVGALGRHHARILAQLPNVELVAVADTNAETGRSVAASCGTRWIADYRELCGQVDAVSIAVPTTAHLSVATAFLSRRIAALVEKPLAIDLEQARRIVQTAEEHGTLLQVGHIERFNPATQEAWKLCGAPKYVRAERVGPFSFRSTDIGVVHDLMIHDLDLVADLVRSDVRRVEAFGVGLMGEHEDSVQARLVFENGCIADLTANRLSPVARRQMQIWSSTGAVTVDFTSREITAYQPSDALLYGPSPVQRSRQPDADIEQLKRDVFGHFLRVEQPSVPATDALTAELTHFVECVRQGSQPLVGGEEALRAMTLADAVLLSVATHQWDGSAEGPVGPFAQIPAIRKLAG